MAFTVIGPSGTRVLSRVGVAPNHEVELVQSHNMAAEPVKVLVKTGRIAIARTALVR